MRFKIRTKFRALYNWTRGYAFSYVLRCRGCDHTIYPSENPCPYCGVRRG